MTPHHHTPDERILEARYSVDSDALPLPGAEQPSSDEERTQRLIRHIVEVLTT